MHNKVFIIGTTGCGKSTFVNGLINGPDSLTRSKGKVNTETEINYGGKTQFQIGQTVTSCTQCPNICELKGNGVTLQLIDCPGFADTLKDADYNNFTIVKWIMSKTNKIQILLVLNAGGMTGKCQDFKKTLASLCRIAADKECILGSKFNFIPLLTKTKVYDGVDEFVHNLELVKEFLQNKENYM